MIPINPQSQSIKQLETLINRYEERGLTAELQYAKYVEEHNRRAAPNLNPSVTIESIRSAARQRLFISYGDIAKANKTNWTKVRRLMPGHLDGVLKQCHCNGWPLITAIVVNQQNILSGKLEEESLAGFIGGVKRLGVSVTDADKFLKLQQELTFDWA